MFVLIGFDGLLELTRSRAGSQELPHQTATSSREALTRAERHNPVQHPGRIQGQGPTPVFPLDVTVLFQESERV